MLKPCFWLQFMCDGDQLIYTVAVASRTEIPRHQVCQCCQKSMLIAENSILPGMTSHALPFTPPARPLEQKSGFAQMVTDKRQREKAERMARKEERDNVGKRAKTPGLDTRGSATTGCGVSGAGDDAESDSEGAELAEVQ